MRECIKRVAGGLPSQPAFLWLQDCKRSWMYVCLYWYGAGHFLARMLLGSDDALLS